MFWEVTQRKLIRSRKIKKGLLRAYDWVEICSDAALCYFSPLFFPLMTGRLRPTFDCLIYVYTKNRYLLHHYIHKWCSCISNILSLIHLETQVQTISSYPIPAANLIQKKF